MRIILSLLLLCACWLTSGAQAIAGRYTTIADALSIARNEAPTDAELCFGSATDGGEKISVAVPAGAKELKVNASALANGVNAVTLTVGGEKIDSKKFVKQY